MMRSALTLAVFVALLASSQSKAGVIFESGFEPPLYTLSALNGQDGWLTSGTVFVQDSIVRSGTQAVAAFDDVADVRALRPTIIDLTANPLLTLSMDVLIGGNFSPAWGFTGIGDSGVLGGVVIGSDGGIVILTGGTPTSGKVLATNTWYKLTLAFNLNSDTFDVLVDGTPVFSNAALLDSSSTAFVAMGIANSVAGQGGALFGDNFEAGLPVPEPSTFMSAGVAVAWYTLRGIRKRSR